LAQEDLDGMHLLGEIAAGSMDAFERFYEQYSPLVLHIALQTVGDRMEAEDVCHDIFLEVWKKAAQFDPKRGSVEAWLAVKARTRCLDRLRRKQRLRIAPADDPCLERMNAEATIEENVFRKMEREVLQNALSSIPAAQARALRGMYVEAQTQREISEQMKRPLGTVKSLIRYGLANMRKQLCQLGWLEPSGGEKKHD